MKTMTSAFWLALILAVAVLIGSAAEAATPPPYMNYQGVLRDNADNPLDGTHDMVFRFFSPADEEILIDRHTTAQGGAVTVSGGLFDVRLGAGATSDGSGPGTYGSLSEVFRDYGEVYLEVQIGTEILSPRTRVLSTAYALNAGTVGGFDSSYFLNTSSASQFKEGPLVIDTDGVPGSTALQANGEDVGGVFTINNGTGGADLAIGNRGIEGFGTEAGGYFYDNDSSGFAYTGYGDYGIQGFGNQSGGYFRDLDQGGEAYVGYGTRGIEAVGSYVGGYFRDSNGSGNAYIGFGDEGIQAYGSAKGGYFANSLGTSWVDVAGGDVGLEAHGTLKGGYFEDQDGTSRVHLAHDDTGVDAWGSTVGAHFDSHHGDAWIAADRVLGSGGADFDAHGIHARVAWRDFSSGNEYGLETTGAGWGVNAEGSYAGGFFADSDGTSSVSLAEGGWAVSGSGDVGGGHFRDHAITAITDVGTAGLGIDASGDVAGGYFYDRNDTGYAYIGYVDEGVSAHGTVQGGFFERDGSGYYTHVAYGSNKVQGPGANSFVQNHPYEKDRVIVYSSPEGDEVATYTRGTARLEGGEARIALGKTFAWVTNPDIGLTAHLTPREQGALLHVESLTTEELVVRSAPDFPDDVAFDYLVFGLRIGFEEVGVVQEKNLEARIPSMDDHHRLYDGHPELRALNALERFKAMESEVSGADVAEFDFSRADALVEAIERYDPEVHGTSVRPGPPEPSGSDEDPAAEPEGQAGGTDPSPPTALGRPVDLVERFEGSRSGTGSGQADLFPVSEFVEPGDLLVLDPEHPGKFRLAISAADPTVVGIVAGEALEGADRSVAPVAGTGFVLVKADAGYGEIRPGDLLTSSFTPGHAMRTTEIVPGTVIGKALEPLETGTDLIKVLVMPR